MDITADELIRELLAELNSGETIETVLLHAISHGQTAGYNKGWHLGYLQHVDELEWERARESA